MPFKLGEMLLKEKIITPEQLDEALKMHMILGIRLGSSLIELGYIEEEDLLRFLSEKLGTPSVGNAAFTSIPDQVIARIPVAIAKKHRVIPFQLTNRRLSVAMTDPADLKAIDELAFVSGMSIEPYIATDILVSSALERYYDIKRDMRYMRVSGQAHGFARSGNEHTAERQSAELLNIEFPSELERFGSQPAPAPPEQQVASITTYSIDKLSMDFAAARNRDDVADVFIKYLGQEFSCGALMIVRGNTANGWRAVLARHKIKGFDEVTIQLDASSTLSAVVTTSRFHMGRLNNSALDLQLSDALKSSPERSHLILPVVMLNKVVALVIVLADTEALGSRLQELQKLVFKASLAFEMLIIKNKILMT